MAIWQKIGCTVIDCEHNSMDDCCCKLNQIQVAPMGKMTTVDNKDETSCASYTQKKSDNPNNFSN